MKATITAAAFVAVTTVCATSDALPRFAARNGTPCIQCHINPTGGGIRNSYGRNVFEQTWLPWSARPGDEPWVLEPKEDAESEDDDKVAFSGDINDWLAIGGDFRAAYLWIRPDRGPTPDTERDITNTFFLMQGDLYHSARLHDRLTLVLDIGLYSGFEAWGLFRLHPEPDSWDLMLKVGRFIPAFGIREVEHQLFTREAIGFGNADRDTGVELTALVGPVAAHVAVLNGTLGDTAIDSHGTERRRFEKAIVSRLSARTDLGWVRGEIGASFYFNQNTNSVNPLFDGAVPTDQLVEVANGLDELRAGAFLTWNLGRFTYLGDLVYLRDDFHSDAVSPVRGYASYQELSLLPIQGLDLVTTLEFADPDLELVDNTTTRAGLVVEFFPWQFTELRAMVRRTWSDTSPTGGAWDVVVFTHLFM